METDRKHPLALRLLLIAAVLGVLGDLFLQNRPWGLGVPLFALAVMAACLAARKFGAPAFSKSATWLGFGAVAFAALFAWRDADGLRLLNLLVLGLTVGAFALRAQLGAVYNMDLLDLLIKGPFQWMRLVGDGPTMLVSDVKWQKISARNGAGRYAALGRGMLLAVVPVGLFIVLLANADAVFEKFVTPNLAAIDPLTVMSHGFVWSVVAILSAGLLRRLYMTPSNSTGPSTLNSAPPKLAGVVSAPQAAPTKIGITEIATVLVALNLVVGLFVLIQFRYLFGGASLVHATTGLSYAQYARRGFFELLAVVSLSIPMVVGMHGLLKRDNPKDEKIFRYTAGLFIVQMFIVAASALERMRLYVDFYSLSPLRLYAVAGMIFVVGVLGLFLGATLYGKTDRFAFSAFAWLGLVVLGLNVANPDALIARYNLQERPGYTVDVNLLGSLSADATPVLLNGMSRLAPSKREALMKDLSEEYQGSRAWASETLASQNGLADWKAHAKR